MFLKNTKNTQETTFLLKPYETNSQKLIINRDVLQLLNDHVNIPVNKMFP